MKTIEIIDNIKTLPFIDNIFSYVKKGGVLVDLFKNNIYINKIDNYDYIYLYQMMLKYKI